MACAVVRSFTVPMVFGADGTVLLAPADPAYHARRALYSFVHFPRVLQFDPYIAFPDGATVPMPPLYDWALGGVARAFGSTERCFETVAAWSSPLLAVLTLLPIFAAARRLGGAAAGLAAAWLFALLPASSFQSAVGYPDHHAAVVLLGACLLASSLGQTGSRGRGVAPRSLGHAAALAAMLLVWSGSLLYVAVSEGTRLVASGVVARRPDRLRAQAVGALGAAVLVAPALAVAPTPLHGPFTATTLSWLHPCVLLGLAGLCGGVGAAESRWPSRDARERVLRLGAAGLFLGGIGFLLVPGLGDALATGLGFVAKHDAWASTNPEQMPLLSGALREIGRGPLARFGLLALLLPPSVVWMVWRIRRDADPVPMTILFGWTAVLSVMALDQVRYAQDLAPPLVVGSSVLMSGVARSRAPSRRLGIAGLAVLVAIALAPTLAAHAQRAQGALRALRDGPVLTPRESLYRFGEAVRRATPPTSGFLDPEVTPEYGILVPPTHGHTMLYVARRPVPANNFGPYLDEAKFRTVLDFYSATTESAARAAADALSARYAMTTLPERPGARRFADRLHASDGAATPEHGAAAHFRLVTEGPARGRPMRFFRREASPLAGVPYKLFEIVEGAVLETRGTPGAPVTVQLHLRTPIGRHVLWESTGAVDETGRAAVRVPHATGPDTAGDARVHALGPYEVRTGDTLRRVHVPEAAVRGGRTVEVVGGGAP